MQSSPLSLDLETSPQNHVRLKKNMESSILEHAFKVRKPYTISKQRERWTEDEHSKFLEALRLYGRAWRKIEENVGTKTAVQIRSHAQKFFSKVVRESDVDGAGETNAVEIPPPRPKRKPMHPYPRKLGNSPCIEKQEWSLILKFSSPKEDDASMPKLLLHEPENLSSTSVLSAVRSDTFVSSASELINSCRSPASSVVVLDAAETSSSEQENGCHLSSILVVEEDEASTRHNCDMELELVTEISISHKEASLVEAPVASVKLFGKTMVVVDAQEPLCSTSENAEQCHPFSAIGFESHCEIRDMGQQVQVQDQNSADAVGAFYPFGTGSSQLSSWPCGMVPMYYILPSHGDERDSAQAGRVAMPWMWAFCGSASPSIATPTLISEQGELSSCSKVSDEESFRKESSAGSNNLSAASSMELSSGGGSTSADGAWQCSSKLTLSQTSALARLKASTSKTTMNKGQISAFTRLKARTSKTAMTKGFVPYKRCNQSTANNGRVV